MCGILGQVSFRKSFNQYDLVKFKSALDLQKHRGPDGSGTYHTDMQMLGHRRLSIIDLGHQSDQPMLSDCGNYALTFNGEIYNYLELRDDLINKGYKFNTKSDTEVLLISFIEYGIDCVDNFIGMFSFAILDISKNVTYIVRDRLGVKPLYYNNTEDGAIFSSEIKSILAINPKLKKLNRDAVSSYMSFRYPILDDTFFRGIYTVPPGSYLKISDSSVTVKEYWNAHKSFKQQAIDKGEEYYIRKLKELLESSVKYRMISDVPFGAFLSGGVDSSVITSIMSNNSVEPIRTFNIGFEESGYNEFEYADFIAKKFHTEHQKIIVTGSDYMETMGQLISYKDAPLSVPNEVPLYIMCKELRKKITVVLSGEGADEIFGGYGKIFRSPYDYEKLISLDKMDISEFEKEGFCKNILKRYAKDYFSSELDHFVSIYNYTSYKEKEMLLNADLDLINTEKALYNKFLDIFNEIANESYTNKIMYVFEKVHLLGLLHRLDTTSMAASIEARVPFVDHRLVEFAFTIPIKYKLKWCNEEPPPLALTSEKISEMYDIPKYILKKSYEGEVPNEVLYRKKVGFPVPINNWFGGEFREYAKKILLTETSKLRGIYNIPNLKKWLDDDKLYDKHHFAMKIWMLVNLELFFVKYFD